MSSEVKTLPTVKLIEIDPHIPFDAATFFQIFHHASAQVNDIQLHYVIGGQGSAVVLLNGYPETWYGWRKIMPALAMHYTVIAIDVRGTGASDKPPTGYDAGTVAADIHQLVQQLGFNQINLVAYDITGRVGYAYAADYPGVVRRLVLIETFIAEKRPDYLAARLLDFFDQAD